VQVQVPDLRQRLLSDAQKVTTDARLRLQVSGDAPSDASKFVVVRQTPEPNATVPAGTTVTVSSKPPPPGRPGRRALSSFPTDSPWSPSC
jgi:beta-lactam-binding protein with PASTA domain